MKTIRSLFLPSAVAILLLGVAACRDNHERDKQPSSPTVKDEGHASEKGTNNSPGIYSAGSKSSTEDNRDKEGGTRSGNAGDHNSSSSETTPPKSEEKPQ